MRSPVRPGSLFEGDQTVARATDNGLGALESLSVDP